VILATVRFYYLFCADLLYAGTVVLDSPIFFIILGLDYTNNFSGNKSPDEFLYNYLADLYGTIDGSRAPNNTAAFVGANGGGATDEGTGGTDDGTNTGTTANQSTGGRRHLRYVATKHDDNRYRSDHQLFSSVSDISKRQDLTNRWNEIDASVMRGFVKSERTGWRLLHQTEHGEAHEIDLDVEYKVQIHLLLA
jgi:hypothetical protein